MVNITYAKSSICNIIADILANYELHPEYVSDNLLSVKSELIKIFQMLEKEPSR